MSEDQAAGRGKGDENAWKQVEKYPVGSRVRGRVASVTESGFLIEIEGRVAGLIAFSDPSLLKVVVNPAKVLEVGDEVEVLLDELATQYGLETSTSI